MVVYVDDMRANFGRMKMCHMVADTEAELHAMADHIGVARRWHQGDHYDIALSKRALAVRAGAVEVSWRTLGAMMALYRETGTLGHPATAEEVRRAQRATRRQAQELATRGGRR